MELLLLVTRDEENRTHPFEYQCQSACQMCVRFTTEVRVSFQVAGRAGAQRCIRITGFALRAPVTMHQL